MRGDKSFADDLIAHRGVVSGRVALLLRSTETKPSIPRFVPLDGTPPQVPWQAGSPLPPISGRERSVGRAGNVGEGEGEGVGEGPLLGG